MDNSNSDLVFNLAQLLKERVGSTRKLHLETPSLMLFSDSVEEEDTLEARDLEGDVKVTRLQDGVLVQGEVVGKVTVECSRCLTDVELPVAATLEEQFRPVLDVETGAAIPRPDIEEDDDSFFDIDANHLMDLSEAIRQVILVSMPMRPLCKEDCKGLCPECGANLNEVDCGHAQEPVDTRWEGLLQLNVTDFPVDKNVN